MKIFVVICVLNLIICSGGLPPEEEPNCHPPLSNIKINLSISHITLRCNFFSTHLTWSFNGKPIAEVKLKFELHKENITLFAPIHLGYYRCAAPPCQQAFFVSPIINRKPATTTPVTRQNIQTTSPTKGIEEIVYFSNFTNHLLLNCSCSNSLISWFANNTLCKAFYQQKLLYSANLTLCNQTTSSHLTLLPPFVAGRYFCLGAAGASPCQQHWRLTYRPTPVTPSVITQAFTSNTLLLYSGLVALTLFLIANLFLVQHLYLY